MDLVAGVEETEVLLLAPPFFTLSSLKEMLHVPQRTLNTHFLVVHNDPAASQEMPSDAGSEPLTSMPRSLHGQLPMSHPISCETSHLQELLHHLSFFLHKLSHYFIAFLLGTNSCPGFSSHSPANHVNGNFF